MAEIGPSIDTSDFAKKSEVPTGPAAGAKVSVVMLPDSGV